MEEIVNNSNNVSNDKKNSNRYPVFLSLTEIEALLPLTDGLIHKELIRAKEILIFTEDCLNRLKLRRKK